jgi:tetratricopeptide (TPR) repeat protein
MREAEDLVWQESEEMQHAMKLLHRHIDHVGVHHLLEHAEICDDARDALYEGEYEQALETTLPLVLLDTPVLKDRARRIAVAALDALIDESYKAGQYERVIQYLDQWLQMEPEAFYPLIKRAEVLQFNLQDLARARRVYLHVLRLYPQSIEAVVGLAEIAMLRGKRDLALQYVFKAWRNLDKSEWAYTKTVRTMRSVFESLYDLTAALFSEGHYSQEAETILNKGLELVGNSEFLHKRLKALKAYQERD